MNFDRARPPLDCGNDDVDAEFGRNADAVDVLLGGTMSQTTADNNEQINLWDYGATGDIVDRKKKFDKFKDGTGHEEPSGPLCPPNHAVQWLVAPPEV